MIRVVSRGGRGCGRGVVRINCRITTRVCVIVIVQERGRRRLVRYPRMVYGLLPTAQTEACNYDDCEEGERANDDAGNCTAGKMDSRMWRWRSTRASRALRCSGWWGLCIKACRIGRFANGHQGRSTPSSTLAVEHGENEDCVVWGICNPGVVCGISRGSENEGSPAWDGALSFNSVSRGMDGSNRWSTHDDGDGRNGSIRVLGEDKWAALDRIDGSIAKIKIVTFTYVHSC